MVGKRAGCRCTNGNLYVWPESFSVTARTGAVSNIANGTAQHRGAPLAREMHNTVQRWHWSQRPLRRRAVHKRRAGLMHPTSPSGTAASGAADAAWAWGRRGWYSVCGRLMAVAKTYAGGALYPLGPRSMKPPPSGTGARGRHGHTGDPGTSVKAMHWSGSAILPWW